MKISIITACLNSGSTIEKTIQSVIEQNYKELEYIVIDGGSTDRTLEILKKYQKNISLLISEPDNGIYDAMNKGIARATGDIIGIINSDDWYEPGVLELVKKFFQRSDADVLYGRLNKIKKNGEVVVPEISSIEKIRYEMAIPHPTVFIKHKIYEKYGTFCQKYKISSDFELMLRLYTKGVKFDFLDKIMANFRHGGLSEKQGKIAEKETLEIARQYLSYAPLEERNYLKNILNHRYKAFCFEKIVDDSSYIIPDILTSQLGVRYEDNIAVFGAGKWGTKTYDALLKKGMHPLFIIDNDERKWNQTENSKKVLSPDILKNFEGVLLVMVREYSAEIMRQVEEYRNPKIYCITWKEIGSSFVL